MLTTETISGNNQRDFDRLATAAYCDKFREHALVDSPALADIILFVGSTYLDLRDVRSHSFLRQYKQKCFLFHAKPYIIPFLPGVYVNIAKRWYSPRRTLTGSHLQQYNLSFIPFIPSFAHCDYLFSFVGSTRTHPVRSRLMSLKHPRAFLEDTSAPAPPEQKKQPLFMVTYSSDDRKRYGDVITRSKFILCPRGYGCSSWRLWETMKAGRVPVIISDQWVPPEGPVWESFSIRVSQNRVMQIPEILEQYEPDAESMGHLARTAWEEWFSQETCFHHIVEWCLRLKQYRHSLAMSDVVPYIQLLRPFFVRHVLLPEIQQGILRYLTRFRRFLSI
jgi:exostosin family protein